MQVNFMHVFLIGSLLAYTGEKGKGSPQWCFTSMGVLALMIPFIVRLPEDLNSYRSLVNASHYLIQMPFFLYIAYKRENAPDGVFPLLKWLGIVLVITHLYFLYLKISRKP